MSESALLRAVRDEIQAHADFNARQVTIEPDEQFPATAADVHIAVLFGGVTAGPTQDTNEGASDLIYGIDVAIAMRSPKKPRDRQWDLWVDTTTSFETIQVSIDSKIDFKNAVMTAANVFITAETSSAGFIETLKLASVGSIRDAPPEAFAGTGGGTAALIRTLQYRGARRVVARA